MESVENVMNYAMIDPKFWKNKNVLVTGHTGFKGAWLCLWLAQMGAKVTGVALPPSTKPSLFRSARVDDVLENSVMLDIRDRAKLAHLVRNVKPQIVIHMAAQPLVRESYKDPTGTYETNVMGTINLLEAVRACKTIRAVVNVTTDKCYENCDVRKSFKETEPLGGYDPYSNSKACSELVTSAYRSSFFNPDSYKKHRMALASARAGNVIGGGDWAKDRLIPDCVRALLTEKKVCIRNPKAIRPWQHVLEPLHGYMILAEKLYQHGPEYAEPWNFGHDSQDSKNVEYVVKIFCKKWGDGATYRLDRRKHPHEAAYLKLDCSKAKAKLGWQPMTHLTCALEWTVTWYRNYYDKRDMRQFTEQQIDQFIAMEKTCP